MVEASPATVRNRNTTSHQKKFMKFSTDYPILWILNQVDWYKELTNARYSFVKISCHSSKFDVRSDVAFLSYKHVTPKGLLTLRFVREEGEKLSYSPSSAIQLGAQNLIKYINKLIIHFDSNLISASFPGISTRIEWHSYPSPRYPGQRRVSFVAKMLRKKPFSHFTTDSTFLMTVIIHRNCMLLMRYKLLQFNKFRRTF